MEGHHLILGETIDFLTGKTIRNTHDEQYRQKIARFLVEKLRYEKKDLIPRIPVTARAENKTSRVMLDLAVVLSGRIYMVIKYGPGSLVTRHRPALAISRLLGPNQVPFVVVTNGEDADILSGETGRVTDSGLNGIPSKSVLLEKVKMDAPKTLSDKQKEMEARILYAFEIDGACPCDDTNSACSLWSGIADDAAL
jgi:hypothetical protein